MQLEAHPMCLSQGQTAILEGEDDVPTAFITAEDMRSEAHSELDMRAAQACPISDRHLNDGGSCVRLQRGAAMDGGLSSFEPKPLPISRLSIEAQRLPLEESSVARRQQRRAREQDRLLAPSVLFFRHFPTPKQLYRVLGAVESGFLQLH
jgi:hypothetical protein